MEAMFNVDQLVVKSYFQPQLKLEYQSVSAWDPLGSLCDAYFFFAQVSTNLFASFWMEVIDCTTFTSISFCQREITWVWKTVLST